MNIIFQINGGLGKSVMATSVCKSIKAKYPEDQLIVITGYPDIFLNNPNVDKCFRHNELKYFYQDYIEGKDFLLMNQEPYQTTSYVKQEEGLVKLWCELLNVPFIQPHGEIYLTKREIDFYTRKYQINKPILVLQTSGSAGDLMYNWSRDIPPHVVRNIISAHKDKYEIVHVRNENQASYDGVTSFTDNIRAVAVMIALSEKRIFNDSCCQHIAAALGKSSDVLWVTTSPKVFGYEIHNNILAESETKPVSLPNSYLTKYDLIADVSQFPYNHESEMFSEEKVNSLTNS